MKYIVWILACVFFVSCKNEDETFHALQFDVDGIELVHSRLTGAYEGEISPEGCVFTLIGKGDFNQFAYITSIFIIDKRQNTIEEYRDLRPNASLSGEWGSIEYLTELSPYAMEIRISPNYGDSPRDIDIQLGYGYWISIINLNQQNIDNSN